MKEFIGSSVDFNFDPFHIKTNYYEIKFEFRKTDATGAISFLLKKGIALWGEADGIVIVLCAQEVIFVSFFCLRDFNWGVCVSGKTGCMGIADFYNRL